MKTSVRFCFTRSSRSSVFRKIRRRRTSRPRSNHRTANPSAWTGGAARTKAAVGDNHGPNSRGAKYLTQRAYELIKFYEGISVDILRSWMYTDSRERQ